VFFNNVEALKLLLNAKADTSAKSDDGFNGESSRDAMEWAQFRNNEQCVQILLAAKVSADASSHGKQEAPAADKA